MPSTITTTVYQYHELGERAKSEARDWWISCRDNTENNLITEIFEYALLEAGYPTGDINWSLSYCQGDGMAFYTDRHDKGDLRRIWLRRISRSWSRDLRRRFYQLLKDQGVTLSLSITRNSHGHHYSHYNTMAVDIEVDGEDDADLNALIQQLEVDLAEDVRDLSKELAVLGYREIEHQQSEEVVADIMEANEYTFTAEGKRFG